MANLIKTTVTIPEDILQMVKLKAVQEKTTLSDIIRNALKREVGMKRRGKLYKDPMKLAGRFKIGITKLYNKRSDLYDDYIKRKMGF